MKLTKENIKEIETFIKNAITTLTTSDYTCCKFNLDGEYALFVGWLDGYDENDETCIHDKQNKSYCLNAGICIRNNYLWCDYEYLNAPIYTDNSGEVYATDCSLDKDDDFYKLARWFIMQYNAIRKLTDAGKLTTDF